MIKIAIKYEIFPSIDDLNTVINGCHYDFNQSYFKTGTWELPETWELPQGLLYANDIRITPHPKTISGLGIFKNTYDEVPGLIFSHDYQAVFICDETLIQIASKQLNKKIILIEIPYEQAFEGIFDFESSLINAKKEME